MTIRVACSNPECRALYSVTDADLGKTTRCKTCGQRFSLLGARSDNDETLLVDVPRADALEVGSVFAGRYRIERTLGAGGMGSVLLAHDQALDRMVALKVPHFRARRGPDGPQAVRA